MNKLAEITKKVLPVVPVERFVVGAAVVVRHHLYTQKSPEIFDYTFKVLSLY